jgi:hypothetical protein
VRAACGNRDRAAVRRGRAGWRTTVAPGAEVLFGIRPHDLACRGVAEQAALCATVHLTEPLGDVTCSTSGRVARCSDGAAEARRSPIRRAGALIRLSLGDAHLFSGRPAGRYHSGAPDAVAHCQPRRKKTMRTRDQATVAAASAAVLLGAGSAVDKDIVIGWRCPTDRRPGSYRTSPTRLPGVSGSSVKLRPTHPLAVLRAPRLAHLGRASIRWWSRTASGSARSSRAATI